jgi:tetratricopeptide (TPR) repeat protein
VRLYADGALEEPLRSQALALGGHHARGCVPTQDGRTGPGCRPDAGATVYRRALRLAETACRIQPGNGIHLYSLGVAQFRAGRYREAVSTLTRSDQLNSKPPDDLFPPDLTLLDLAQHRLGQSDKAQAALGRLRETRASKIT